MTVMPMLATRAESIPAGPEWAHQIKWDGIRLMADVKRSGVKCWSRNANDLTDKWPGLVRYRGRDLLIDAEVVSLDQDGLPDPVALRRRGAEVMLMVFDLLRLDGKDLTQEPWTVRQEALTSLKLGGKWHQVASVDDGEAMFRAAKVLGLEGVVSKRRASLYQAGHRSHDWKKIKIYGD